MRSLATSETRPLAGAEGVGTAAVWLPDSRFLLFSADGQLKKLDVFGGAPQTLCAFCPGLAGAALGHDGVVLIATALSGMLQMPAGGGTPAPAAGTSNTRGDLWLLPDGRRLLQYRRGEGIVADMVGDSNPKRVLAVEDPRFVYVRSPEGRDYILFDRAGSLLAQPFDSGRAEAVGQPGAIASEVVAFGASNTGVLAYRAGASRA